MAITEQDRTEIERGRVWAAMRAEAEARDWMYINPDALDYEQYARYQRKPASVHGLCKNGYHQPDFHHALDPCEMVGCRCYCHHPLEVASYKARKGQCSECGGTGAIGKHRCPLCYGSGYGSGYPATMKRCKQEATA